ncbi:MAG: helix-turn-helix domain-containing protein [Lachnospiraceae bacterium]|nr:helix-turn-helix domain-containing protein [Lachnospiraceae bacterium]
MKYNLNISEDAALELFHSQVMMEKADILTNIHWQIESAQEELEDADLARTPFLRTLIEMLGRFERKIDKSPLFTAPADWWAFSFEIASTAITLNLEHYTSVTFSSEREIEDSDVDATLPLLSVKAGMLTVDEFAKRNNVLPVTVRQWIRRGKLRTAVKNGAEWRIPELTEIPVRGYRGARYEWDTDLTGLPEEFAYISNYRSAEFSQDEADKNLYHIDFSDGEKDVRVNCNTKGREQIELMLISHPFVNYVSDSFGIFA